MKNFKLILLLLLPLTFFAQESKQLSGLWTGTLSNDSNTVRKNQEFELALAEYRGKVTGYSRMTFIVHDTLYYIVKRVKGTIDGNICEVEDDEIITHNFPKSPDKKVKLISTFRRNKQDSIWRLDGEWKTNKTKQYYSVSGKIALAEEKDLSKSKLFPHLDELKLGNDVPFYAEEKKKEEQQRIKTKIQTQAQTGIAGKPVNTRPDVSSIKTNSVAIETKTISIESKPETFFEPEEQKEIKQNIVQNKPPVSTIKTNSVAVNNKISSAEKKPVAIINKPTNNTSTIPVNTVAADSLKPAIGGSFVAVNKTSQDDIREIKKFSPNSSGAAAFVDKRIEDAPQFFTYKNDSLVLALYDNGEVDGDTVSVIINGEIVMAKEGLKTTAIKKTIYPKSNNEGEMKVVLYAENLGKYPPNTGLLVVYDGEERYLIRFSADFEKNATVVFRRKK